MAETSALVQEKMLEGGENGVPYPDHEVKNILYKLGALWNMLPTAWFHFFFVEFRAVYGLYLAGYYFYSGIAPPEVAGKYWTFDNTRGYWNLSAIAYCILLHIFAAVKLVKECGAARFTDAKYLKWTYDLEGSLWYKIAVKILILFVVASAIRVWIFICFEHENITTWEFATKYYEKILALLAMVTALESEERKFKKQHLCCTEELATPDLDWNGEAFQNVKFTRNIKDLFLQSNDAFANKVMVALWVATSSKDGGKLFQCVEKESWEEALKIKAQP